MTRWHWLRYSVAVALLAGCTNNAGVVLISGCNNTQTARIDFHTTAALDGVESVVVETQNGQIEIKSDARAAEADIHGTKVAGGATKEEAESNAAEIQIVAKRDDARSNLLRIAAVFPQVMNRNQGVSFTITLPPALKVDLKTHNGAIVAGGNQSGVRAETTNGSIRLTDIQGDITAHSTNGMISARQVAGDIRVTTSNGSIELTGVRAGQVQAQTSNGRIHATDLEAAGSVALKSSNGSIDADITRLPDNPDVTVDTSNASVNLELPESTKATLTARTTNAKVHADLSAAAASNISSEGSRFHATLNGGGGKVDVHSSNGSVTVKAVPASQPSQASLSVRIWKRLIG